MGRKIEITESESYNESEMGSFGHAAYMLICQHQFPVQYWDVDEDKLISVDSDRAQSWDYDHFSRLVKEYTGTGELGLSRWFQRASDLKIFEFLKKLLKHNNEEFTGYRILYTVNRSNGYPVITMELFNKGTTSDTEVENNPRVNWDTYTIDVRKVGYNGRY